MPYIDPKRRTALSGQVGAWDDYPTNVGELTYVVTRACDDYLEGRTSFADLAEVIAALEAAKLEFYRRVVAPYEDEKLKANGDVYIN